jgi:hypothetical protein
MRNLSKVTLGASVVSLAWLVTAAGGCGKLKPANVDAGAAGSTAGAGGTGGGGGSAGSSRTLVTVSGTAAPHPLNAIAVGDGGVDEFSMLKVSIVDPTAIILDPNAAPLATQALDTTTAGNCSATAGCKWSLSGVDITNQTLGLVGTLEDTRTGDARLYVKTGTGMGTKTFLEDVRKTKTPITDRRAFVVSRKLEAKLAAFVSVALGQTFAAGDLEKRGFLIGHVLGRLSSATTPAGPAGVAGATVTATGDFDVIYPTADFTGKGDKTSATGIFLMVPRLKNGAAVPVVTNWMVVPPTGDARTWEAHIAGSNPNNAFIIIMPADEAPTDGGTDGGASDATIDTAATDGGASDATTDTAATDGGASDATTDVASDKPADGGATG